MKEIVFLLKNQSQMSESDQGVNSQSTDAAFFGEDPSTFGPCFSPLSETAIQPKPEPQPRRPPICAYFSGYVLYVLYHTLYVRVVALVFQVLRNCLGVGYIIGASLRGLRFRTHKSALIPGARVSYSLTNLLDPLFDTPNYFPIEEFPSPVNGLNNHFLMMVSKLVYEDPAIVHDIAVNKWGIKKVQLMTDKAESVRAYIFTFSTARVVVFRGAADLGPFISSTLVNTPHLGCVDKATYDGLFDVQGTQSLAHRLLFALMVAHQTEKGSTYVAGHSTGGALASVFAAHLLSRSIKLGGLHTYGQPRSGDEAFVSIINQGVSQGMLGECVRMLNACDVVPMLPLNYHYVHHVGYTRLTPSGRIEVAVGPSPDERWTSSSHINVYRCVHASIRKVLRTPIDESGLRSIVRCLFFLFPGLNDHMPCDYERILRQNVVMTGNSKMRTIGRSTSEHTFATPWECTYFRY